MYVCMYVLYVLILESNKGNSRSMVNFLYRFKSDLQTDRRVCVMNEVITGIRVIKMYAWEYAFKKLITAIRK